MEKEKIIEVLNKWNFWTKTIDTGIPRTVYSKKIVNFTISGKIISIVGVRRSGKSTIMKQVANEFARKVGKENTLIISLEEPEFEDANLQLLQKIYEAYNEIVKPKTKPLIFLDEIQNVPKWEKFVRSLQERKEAFITITGSSSKMLSEELATVLAGRQIYFEIFPLSFREFLDFNNIKISTVKDALLNSTRIRSLLRDYLEYGSYPEIALNESKEFKIKTLRSYYDDILTKDVITRYGIKEIEKLRTLVKFYLTNISTLISYNSIARFLNLPVETIRRFTSYVESSKSIFFIKRFSFKIKEQENSQRKVYSIDTGLSNTMGFRFSENIGRSAENAVAIELARKQSQNPLLELYYFHDQTHKEVDFVLKERTKIKQLIQACWDTDDYNTKERETSSLIKASKELKCNNLLIITEDKEGEEMIKGKKIRYVPLWKWLLK